MPSLRDIVNHAVASKHHNVLLCLNAHANRSTQRHLDVWVLHAIFSIHPHPGSEAAVVADIEAVYRAGVLPQRDPVAVYRACAQLRRLDLLRYFLCERTAFPTVRKLMTCLAKEHWTEGLECGHSQLNPDREDLPRTDRMYLYGHVGTPSVLRWLLDHSAPFDATSITAMSYANDAVSMRTVLCVRSDDSALRLIAMDTLIQFAVHGNTTALAYILSVDHTPPLVLPTDMTHICIVLYHVAAIYGWLDVIHLMCTIHRPIFTEDWYANLGDAQNALLAASSAGNVHIVAFLVGTGYAMPLNEWCDDEKYVRTAMFHRELDTVRWLLTHTDCAPSRETCVDMARRGDLQCLRLTHSCDHTVFPMDIIPAAITHGHVGLVYWALDTFSPDVSSTTLNLRLVEYMRLSTGTGQLSLVTNLARRLVVSIDGAVAHAVAVATHPTAVVSHV
jgi:hypothetical protein